jgi:hypothetical protein
LSTTTTNYGYVKPGVNDPTDEDLWGGYLNDDLDGIDAELFLTKGSPIVTKTTTYTVLTTDKGKTIACDATGGGFTLTLPVAATAGNGFKVSFIKTDSSSNNVTIDGDGSETINGATSYVFTNQYETVTLLCTGSSWNIISSPVSTATQADMEAETAGRYPDAAVLKSHPGVAKAWANFNGQGVVAVRSSYNVASITDNGTGNYTVNLTIPFSDTNYCVVANFCSTTSGGQPGWQAKVSNIATSSFTIYTGVDGSTSSALADPPVITFVAFGDQ